MEKEYCITVLFGSEQVKKFYNKEIFNEDEITDYTKFYSFKTDAELNAFILGLNEANGWLDLIYLEGVKIENQLLVKQAIQF